jgi:shikimate kinase
MDHHRAPVFLVGFMGCGKSTVGRALAAITGREFVDLDERIVEEEGRSIARILSESGEPYFRDLERRLLGRLRGRADIVVACGGGTYAHAPSRALIDELGTAVWLQVPLAEALARCRQGGERPLLGGPGRAEALYRSRLPAYRAAPVHVDVDGLTPEEAAARVASRL